MTVFDRPDLVPLWDRPPAFLPLRPPPGFHLWEYVAVRSELERVAGLLDKAASTRRVALLAHPDLDGAAATDGLHAGIQMLLATESADDHRHTPSALRVGIEATDLVTTVDGEELQLGPLDVVLNPSGTWHGHSERGGSGAVWLDVVDLPLVSALGGVLFEPARSSAASTLLDPDAVPAAKSFPWLTMEPMLFDSEQVDGVRRLAYEGGAVMSTLAVTAYAVEEGGDAPAAGPNRGHRPPGGPRQLRLHGRGPDNLRCVVGSELDTGRADESAGYRHCHRHRHLARSTGTWALPGRAGVMRLANLEGRPVVIEDGLARPIDPALVAGGDPFIGAIRRWSSLGEPGNLGEGRPFDVAKLGPPMPKPGKILGAPVNYLDHKKEMKVEHTVAGLGFFLKSPSSIVGGDGTVVLPFPGRRTDQEAELGVVIGATADNVPLSRALDHVFGYTCLVDVTVRGGEERSTRKSFAGFTPIGPWITTTAEIPDPTDLRIRGWVNDELRQDESTAQMVYGVAQLIEFMSSVVTLEPGDVIATGTPAGVGPVGDGDVIAVEIDRVGRLEIPVSSSGREPHPLWLTREAE